MLAIRNLLAGREGGMRLLSSSWLRDPDDCTESCLVVDFCSEFTILILVFCYGFEFLWSIHLQLQGTVIEVFELSSRLYLL